MSQELIYRTIHPEVRVVDEERGIVDYVASDETLDSYREIIRANGWRFTNFKKNAPFVDSHQYGSIAQQVGKVIDFKVDGKRLIERVQWAIDVPENGLAQLGWKMTKAGYLKAVSVGFFPVRSASRFDSDPQLWREQLRELGIREDSGVRTIYIEQEQVELSACIIGANPNALAKARAAGVITAEEEEISLVRQREIDRAAPSRAHAARSEERARSGSQRSYYDHSYGVGNESGSARQSTARVELVEKFKSMEKTSAESKSRSFDDYPREQRRAIENLTLKKRSGDFREREAAVAEVMRLRKEERTADLRARIRSILRTEENVIRFSAAVYHWCDYPLLPVHKELLGIRQNRRAEKAIGEDSSPGSTLIDDHLWAEIYDTLAEFGSWARLGVRKTRTKNTKFTVRTARPSATWETTEAGTIDDDTATAAGTVTCTSKVISVLLRVSRQLMEDQEIATIAEETLFDFVQSFNERLDTSVYVGDGTNDATYGGFTGVFNFGTPAVAQTGNVSAEALDFDDFRRCLQTVDPVVLRRQPWWYLHPTILALIMGVREGGRSIVLTNAEAPSAGFGSCLGFPLELVHAAPATNGANKQIAAFGEPNAYVVGIWGSGFRIEGSEHVLWNTLERSVRGFGRCGGIGRRATGFAILKTANA